MNLEENINSVFDRSGIASEEDLKSACWHNLYRRLEQDQSEFLAEEKYFRSLEYRKKWPSDALHWWSRVWEYPYVMYHIEKWFKNKCEINERCKVVDFGSGVTFFPFSIARLGLEVCCVDIDEVCGKDLEKAIKRISTGNGSVSYKIISDLRLPFDNDEIDALYCVSVLEHIQDFINAISEMSRILKPGGLCLLTIDLDLLGNSEIGVDKYDKLRNTLEKYFKYVAPERSIHPANMLKSNSGPFPMPEPSMLLYVKAYLINRILKPMILQKGKKLPPKNTLLALQGFVLQKKEQRP